MDDFNEVVRWCAEHRVGIKIEAIDQEHLMVSADMGPITSEALFTDSKSFLEAAYFVLSSVQAGFNYHMQHGFVPKVPQ